MIEVPDLCVVDTNVGVVANGADVCLQCQLKCVEVLQTIVASRRIALDAGNEIFSEYSNHLSLAGQPGVGDTFMKWVHDNTWNEERCTVVPLTAVGDSFEEFPADAALVGF